MASSVPIDFTVGIETAGAQQILKIFPVPANEELILELPYEWKSNPDVIIHNLAGEAVKIQGTERKGNRVYLNIQNLAKGFYSLQCVTGIEIWNGSFVK